MSSTETPNHRANRSPRRARSAEALPYMRRYAGKTIVVKYGGHAMGDERGARLRARHRAAEADRHQPDRRAWRRPADRPDAGAPQDQELASSTACASPTPRPSKSSRWSCRARSTSRSSAPSTPPAAAPSAFPARMATSSTRASSTRTKRDPDSNIERILDLGFVGEPERIDPRILDDAGAVGHHPGRRADRRRPDAARPTTSTPTPWRAPSPPRSRPRASSC